MSTGLTIVRIVLPLIVLGVGVGTMTGLIATKPAAEATPRDDSGVLVRTIRIAAESTELTVTAQGTVLPAQEVKLQAEVQGRVISRSRNLVPGGRFEKGEQLLRVDPGEYSLRAQASAAQVEQAKQQLAIEESRGEIAQEEWKLIGEDQNASESGRNAALRKPQRAEAEARMKSAESERYLALLNVGRTSLLAPFNGFVRDGRVDVGQFISPGAQLGTLVGSDAFWVQVSVPVERLSRIKVPGFNAAAEEGSDVKVWQQLGEEQIERMGRVLRLYSDLDPVGRLARVLVQIDDPLGLEVEEAERGLPLLLGAYVQVDIGGEQMVEAVEIPRSAIHAGRYVYIYGPENRLEVREIEIGWRRAETVLVRSGLSDGEEIVTSRLPNAVDGLKLRRAKDEPKQAAAPKTSAGAKTSAAPESAKSSGQGAE